MNSGYINAKPMPTAAGIAESYITYCFYLILCLGDEAGKSIDWAGNMTICDQVAGDLRQPFYIVSGSATACGIIAPNPDAAIIQDTNMDQD